MYLVPLGRNTQHSSYVIIEKQWQDAVSAAGKNNREGTSKNFLRSKTTEALLNEIE
jgi:hypothetical protein